MAAPSPMGKGPLPRCGRMCMEYGVRTAVHLTDELPPSTISTYPSILTLVVTSTQSPTPTAGWESLPFAKLLSPPTLSIHVTRACATELLYNSRGLVPLHVPCTPCPPPALAQRQTPRASADGEALFKMKTVPLTFPKTSKGKTITILCRESGYTTTNRPSLLLFCSKTSNQR